MNRTTLTAAALILLNMTPGSASAANTITQAVHNAVTTNPNVTAEEAAKEAAEKDIRDAEADLYPKLDLRGTTGYAYSRKKFYNDGRGKGAMSTVRDGEANRFTGTESARLTQIIFDGFRTGNSIRRAEHARDAAVHTVHQAQENTALDAVAAYVDVRARRRLLELAEENVKTHEKILNKVRQRVGGGLGTVADTRQVEARLQDAKIAVEQIEGDLGIAIAAFIDTVGYEPHDLDDSYLNSGALPEDIDHIVALALQENPQVRIAENLLLVAESDYEIAGAPWWPTIRAESEILGEHNIDGIKGDEASYTLQLVGEYNLYSGGRDTARRESQLKRMAEAKYRLGIARRAAEREVRSAYSEMMSSRDQVTELAKAAKINDQLRKDYFVQFDLGDRSLLDVLDAEVAYFRSRSSKVLAEAEESINYARILAATARLNPSLDTGHAPAHPDSHLSADVPVTHSAGAPDHHHDHGPHADGHSHPYTEMKVHDDMHQHHAEAENDIAPSALYAETQAELQREIEAPSQTAELIAERSQTVETVVQADATETRTNTEEFEVAQYPSQSIETSSRLSYQTAQDTSVSYNPQDNYRSQRYLNPASEVEWTESSLTPATLEYPKQDEQSYEYGDSSIEY